MPDYMSRLVEKNLEMFAEDNYLTMRNVYEDLADKNVDENE